MIEREYELIRPFGPTIYRSTLNEETMTLQKDCAVATREANQNVGNDLAGNIESQLQAVMNNDQQQEFMKQVSTHLGTYMQQDWDRRQEHMIVPSQDNPDFKNMSFNLNTGPWINFQQANEFNPMHSHAGIISAILYIDVPEVIAKEAQDDLQSNMRCPGQLEFLYGSDVLGVNGTHKVIPKTGDILLFHAGLKHSVYPYKSNVERVSMSFNVWSVEPTINNEGVE